MVRERSTTKSDRALKTRRRKQANKKATENMLAMFIAAGQPISNGSTAAKPKLEPNADDFDAEISSHTQAVNARSIAITSNSSSNSGDGIFGSNRGNDKRLRILKERG